jgi:hypothetical protein
MRKCGLRQSVPMLNYLILFEYFRRLAWHKA